MLALELDTLAPRHERLRAIVLGAMDEADATGDIAKAIERINSWDGTASADQSGYRLLNVFRRQLRREVITPLVAPCLEIEEGFAYRWTNTDEPVLRLIEEAPAHLLSPEYASWDDLVRGAFARAVTRCAQDGGIDRSWGDANRADITHPMSEALPGFLRRFVDMPRDPLAGDSGVVRVSTPGFGASLRLVASPGRLEDAIFHMPCGQSGHPLSANYRDGHLDWLEGAPSPLLPGAPVSTLRLIPDF